jgi:hypothetical protein
VLLKLNGRLGEWPLGPALLVMLKHALQEAYLRYVSQIVHPELCIQNAYQKRPSKLPKSEVLHNNMELGETREIEPPWLKTLLLEPRAKRFGIRVFAELKV